MLLSILFLVKNMLVNLLILKEDGMTTLNTRELATIIFAERLGSIRLLSGNGPSYH